MLRNRIFRSSDSIFKKYALGHDCGNTYCTVSRTILREIRCDRNSKWKSLTCMSGNIAPVMSSWGGISKRWNSSKPLDSGGTTGAPTTTTDLPPGYIPEPPTVPQAIPDGQTAESVLNALGEPTLSSLGLCNYTPVGFMQGGLETLHVACDLPWWGAILAGTLIIRTCVFPIVIWTQKGIANMSNHMPTIQVLQERFSQAKLKGNYIEASRIGKEMSDYMKRNNVNPLKNMMMPFIQFPIFISVFIALRKMATLPVASLQEGGLWWFTDLTVADPYYILPLLSMTTLLTTIELGVDAPQAASMSHGVKWFMRAMPVIMLPLVINFPSAILCYWLTTNVFSLCQMLFLRIKPVRAFFKIPPIVAHPKKAVKKKPFIEGFRDSMNNSKLMAQMEDRQRAEFMRFKEAGNKPVVKTYPYDPTKVKGQKQALKAKS